MPSPGRALLEGFVDALAGNGVPVAPPRRIDFLRAVAATDLPGIDRLYWIARVTLVSGHDQIERFDRVFDAWFCAGWWQEAAAEAPEREDEQPTDRPGEQRDAMSTPLDLGEGTGRQASRDDLANRRRLANATADERERWQRTVAAARERLPTERGRRRRPHRRHGAIDLRRVLRGAMRAGGEIAELRYRKRPRRQRRVLVLIDVSGSLKADSPGFLRFAHALVHGAERAEVFTFGTRLTRITPGLRAPDLDEAMAALAPVVRDFDGGTRIGEALERLLATGRYLPFSRGALVLVLSDGLERGDPAAMQRATDRLSRLGHRLVWLSPLLGDPAYRPATRGMLAILPLLDRLGDASSPDALLHELERLPDLERQPRRNAAARFRAERRTP